MRRGRLLEVRILGPLTVHVDGREVPLGGARQRAVLAVLVLHANEPVALDRIVEDVWGSERPATSDHAVQVYVSRLRKTLGAYGPRVLRSGSGYALSLADDELDERRFRSLLDAGRHTLAGDPAAAGRLLREALELWRGPPLADLAYESFVQTAIGELDELRLTAVETRIEADLALARHDDVLPELERLVAEHPLRERLRAHVMLALYRSGRQADALEAYSLGRELLVEELGLEPGEDLRALHRRILRHDPSLAVESPELAARRHLPAPPTALVGRRQEVDGVTALLRGPARVVTLLGPGGVGKTRVALQAAHELAEAFADGVYFVDLAPLGDAELVGSTIARAVGLTETSGEALREYLRPRALLLVLDNFEHVDAAAPLVSALLAEAPQLRALVTSRSPLRVYGEHEFEIAPLEANDAVELLAARAAAASREWELGEADRSLAVEICARLDRLPLAIELAAARTPEFTLAELAERLPGSLEPPAGGPRDLPSRQQTLRGAIAWSYDLLPPDAQRLFARLSCFAGGCTADAAERVCDATAAQLDALVRSSLLRRRRRAQGTRYAMLETIRAYAAERLSDGDATRVRPRHAAYFLELAERAEPELTGPEAATWLDRLETEHDNFRSALTQAAAAGDATLGLRLAGALRFLWEVRGHYSEARRWLEGALDASVDTPSDVLSKAIHSAATFALNEGDLERARELWQRDLELGRSDGDRYRIARALGQLGSVVLAEGDEDEAARLYEESAELLRTTGETRSLAVVLSNLGAVAARRGDWERARRFSEDALALQRELGLRADVAISLHNVGRLSMRQDDDEAARESLRASLMTVRELAYKEIVAYCLEGAAELAARSGDWELAARLLGAAELLFDALGARMYDDERVTYEQTVRGAAAQLGAERLAALRAEGRELGPEAAVTIALENALAPSPTATTRP